VLVKPLEGTQTSVLEDILVTLDQLRGVSESVEEDSILAALRERTLAEILIVIGYVKPMPDPLAQ